MRAFQSTRHPSPRFAKKLALSSLSSKEEGNHIAFVLIPTAARVVTRGGALFFSGNENRSGDVRFNGQCQRSLILTTFPERSIPMSPLHSIAISAALTAPIFFERKPRKGLRSFISASRPRQTTLALCIQEAR